MTTLIAGPALKGVPAVHFRFQSTTLASLSAMDVLRSKHGRGPGSTTVSLIDNDKGYMPDSMDSLLNVIMGRIYRELDESFD